MAKGTIDMSGVDEQGMYKLPPEGEYVVSVTETKDKITQSGDPMISITLEIVSGEFKGCLLWDNIILSNNPDSPGYKILGKTKHFLRILGESYEGKIEWDSDNWMRKECKIRLNHESPNEYHSYPKAIVGAYILDDRLETEKNDVPF